MKRTLIFAACVAIAAADAALGQSRQEQASTAALLPALQPARVFPLGTAAPMIAPPSNAMLQAPVVISFGRGGKVDEHRQQFAIYQSRRVKVEVRGPCYSACTLLMAYVEKDNLCIASGAFMAVHAIRSMEHGEKMPAATRQFYNSMPELVQLWIDANGGWENLPLNGYWTMYDRTLWQMGYPKCQ